NSLFRPGIIAVTFQKRRIFLWPWNGLLRKERGDAKPCATGKVRKRDSSPTKMKRCFPCLARMVPALIVSLLLSPTARALVITSAPAFTPADAAPLAGALGISTDIPSRVSISVTEGTNTWRRNFYDYATTHSVPLLGFKPGRTNLVTVTVLDRYRNAVTAP